MLIFAILIIVILILVLPFKKSRSFKFSLLAISILLAIFFVRCIPVAQDLSFCEGDCPKTQKTTIMGYIVKLVDKGYPEPYVYMPGESDGKRLPI